MERRTTELNVFDGERLVGTVYDTSPLSFSYAAEWLKRSNTDRDAYAIANISLQPGLISTPDVEVVFENLLPEGIVRDMLSKESKASSTFAFLVAVAGDTAGGLTILPAGKVPEPASYTVVDWQYIAKHLAGNLEGQATKAPLGSRISLAGAQMKMLISLDTSNSPMLPEGTTPSTWIVKPDIRWFPKVWGSAVNEALMMRTAAHCGLGVAEVFFEPITRTCVIKRFDRITDSKGPVVRLRQYDFCQLSGTTSGKKYEAEGGPGVSKCAELIRIHSSNPAADLLRFCQWLFFNLYIGNNDGHAKNLSLYYPPGQGVRLTPFYDLMDTRFYPGLSTSFAMRIGGEDEPGKITHEHLAMMSAELNMRPTFIINIAKSMYAKLGPALQQAISEIEPQLDYSGKTLSKRLAQHVTKTAAKTVARFMS